MPWASAHDELPSAVAAANVTISNVRSSTPVFKALNSVAQETGKGDIKPYISIHIKETAAGGYAIGGQIFG